MRYIAKMRIVGHSALSLRNDITTRDAKGEDCEGLCCNCLLAHNFYDLNIYEAAQHHRWTSRCVVVCRQSNKIH